ncbi:MAG: hypothetical protein BWX80_03879 [Candidatus Hydrogenedentes bacterium ADurb.Bin101]|nr:MAG: hypothetical protein BWX80_03879 [Candidatus Hydrogenedentes bacterium ADurb.Bin101]
MAEIGIAQYVQGGAQLFHAGDPDLVGQPGVVVAGVLHHEPFVRQHGEPPAPPGRVRLVRAPREIHYRGRRRLPPQFIEQHNHRRLAIHHLHHHFLIREFPQAVAAPVIIAKFVLTGHLRVDLAGNNQGGRKIAFAQVHDHHARERVVGRIGTRNLTIRLQAGNRDEKFNLNRPGGHSLQSRVVAGVIIGAIMPLNIRIAGVVIEEPGQRIGGIIGEVESAHVADETEFFLFRDGVPIGHHEQDIFRGNLARTQVIGQRARILIVGPITIYGQRRRPGIPFLQHGPGFGEPFRAAVNLHVPRHGGGQPRGGAARRNDR